MTKIKFLNVPKKERYELVGKRFGKNSKAMDIATANAKVKAIAEELDEDKKVTVDLEVDSNEKVYTVSNVSITSADKYSGLQSMADRLLTNTDNSSEQNATMLNLANVIEAELQTDNLHEDISEDVDYLYADSENKSEELAINRKEKESEKNDDSRSVRGVAPENEDKEDPNDDLPNLEEVSTVSPNPEDFLSGENDAIQQKSDIDKEDTTILTRSSYVAAKSLFQAITDKDSQTVFNIDELRKRLGYVTNPQDKYQRELNTAIEQALDKCHLRTAAVEYEKATGKLKKKALNELNDVYDEVNKSLLEDTIAGKAANKFKENKAQAEAEKSENKKEIVEKKAAKAKELEAEAEKEIAEATKRIKHEKQVEQENFEHAQDLLLEKRNMLVDRDLEKKNQSTEIKYRNTEVQERNSTLRDKHQEIENQYSKEIEKVFEHHRSKFEQNTDHLVKSIQAQAALIERQKRKDERAAKLEQQNKAKIIKMQEIAALKKKANELKEQELAYREKHDKEYPEELTKTLSAGVAQAIKEALREQREAAKTGKTIDLDKAIDKHIKEDSLLPVITKPDKSLAVNGEFKKPNEEKSSKPTHKVVRKLGLAAILLLGLGSLGYYEYVNLQPKSKLTSQEHKSAVIKPNKAIQDSEKTSGRKRVTRSGKHSRTQHKSGRKVHDSNVLLYYAAKSWSAKIDVMDGALGQGDIRALKEINDAHSTWISKLYYAIAANDQNSMRAIYVQLTPRQKQKVSYAARHAIALAFYNVKDWQNGWLARNGY